MEENWYALFIASQLPVQSADEAFDLFYTGDKRYIKTRKSGIEMLLMQSQGYTDASIARKYGVNVSTAYTRLRTAKNVIPEEI